MKINTLSLTDFRAFPGPAPATFELGGKNLLVCLVNPKESMLAFGVTI